MIPSRVNDNVEADYRQAGKREHIPIMFGTDEQYNVFY